MKDKTIRLSLKFFEKCAQNIILLTELNLHKELNPSDFQSVFILKNKLDELFKGEEDLIENKEIYEKSLELLNDIHMDFIKGKYDEVIIPNKKNNKIIIFYCRKIIRKMKKLLMMMRIKTKVVSRKRKLGKEEDQESISTLENITSKKLIILNFIKKEKN